MIYNRTRPENLHSQGVWYNKGDWNFEELDVEFGVNDNGVTLTPLLLLT